VRRLLLGLLGRTLPDDWRDDILRDLEEAHARRVAARGRLAAGVWLAGQTVLFAARFATERTAEGVAALIGGEAVASLMQDVGPLSIRISCAPMHKRSSAAQVTVSITL
jgi:hypothetical protein